jgi:hypothetical protein
MGSLNVSETHGPPRKGSEINVTDLEVSSLHKHMVVEIDVIYVLLG